MSLLTLPNVVAAAMLVSLNAYVLFGGADFGGGVWDLFARGTRRSEQRALIASAIGPIWEANHVWLILVVVVLFSCFPPAFSAVATTLHIPLSIMLIGIVLRGSAFTFRAYDRHDDATQRRWGAVFSVASLVTPLVLGMCVGAIAAGSVTPTPPADIGGYVSAWLQPFPMAVGVLTLALFALLAAVYLTVETADPALRDDFRRRAFAAAAVSFVSAFGALLLARTGAPQMGARLTTSPWALLFHLATGVAAVVVLVTLWTRRFRLARLAAAAQVSLVLWGWAFASYPDVLPGSLSIADAAAPPVTLRLTLWALALGAVVLMPSLVYLFRVFKSGEAVRP